MQRSKLYAQNPEAENRSPGKYGNQERSKTEKGLFFFGFGGFSCGIEFFHQSGLAAGSIVGMDLPALCLFVQRPDSGFNFCLSDFQISGSDGTFSFGNLSLGAAANGLIALLPSPSHAHFFFCSFSSRQMNLLKYVTYVILSFFQVFSKFRTVLNIGQVSEKNRS
jgi:hypothetical protein